MENVEIITVSQQYTTLTSIKVIFKTSYWNVHTERCTVTIQVMNDQQGQNNTNYIIFHP